MSNSRLQILEMLAAGQINVREAEWLLDTRAEETEATPDRPAFPPDRCIRCMARLAAKLESTPPEQRHPVR